MADVIAWPFPRPATNLGPQLESARASFMDSTTGTGFDEHEGFFESYDAEQELSVASFELPNEAPSAEQLARSGRFRKPVALLVSAMALFSAAALISLHRRAAQSELVAHYGAALPAATPVSAASAPSSVADAPAEPSAEVVSATVPELTVSAADPEPETSAVAAARAAPSPAAVKAVASPVAPALLPPTRSSREPSSGPAAGAQAARSPFPSRAHSPPTVAPVIAAPKAVIAAPRSFNSVASFPDVQH